MNIHYRMSYPYYGHYKYKITIKYDWQESEPEKKHKQRAENVKNFLTNNWDSVKDYKWSSDWCIYIRDKDVFDDINKNYPNHLQTVYMPAPGYEHLEGKNPRQSRILWYDRYPYKIVLDNVDRKESVEYILWCNENIKGKFRSSSGGNKLSLFFMNSFDALAAKLKYGDHSVKTYMADSEKAAEELRKKMELAKKEYYEYLEGEGLDDECK